jgi:CheY-like chemotaxis protein
MRLCYIRLSVNRLPVNPLIMRGLRLAEEELGMAGLIARLGVSAGAIDDWRMGLVAMPHDKFLELVDMLASIDPSWRRADPSVLPPEEAKRILVVDDNADAALTLNHLLELLGHQSTAVIDSRNAIDVAAQLRPQIAILDINMPHVTGLDLARLFRQHDELKDCHLVALTAMDGMNYREMIRQAGFDAHLRKPADMALLRAIIAQFKDEAVRR